MIGQPAINQPTISHHATGQPPIGQHAAPSGRAALEQSSARRAPLGWKQIFGIGLVLWIVSVVLLVTTEAITLLPTVILLGSFLVPVTAAVFFFDHDLSPTLQPRTVVNAFLIGGLLGVYGAVLLEAWFLQPGFLQFSMVGLIEELAKLLALVLVAWRLPRYTTRDGIVLGAAVGFGFGALESSGYAFTAMLTQQGLSVADLVQVEVLRGLLAPVGHGLWTGIVGGALFAAASAAGRLRLTWPVAGTYLLAAALHGLWDAIGGLAVLVTFILTATPAQRAAVESGALGRIGPTQVQTEVYMLIYWGGLAIISIVGVLWLRSQWRHAGPADPIGSIHSTDSAPAAAPVRLLPQEMP